MEKEYDIRLCNAECGKLHCARNKNGRFSHKKDGEDLKRINSVSLCENYLPKYKLKMEQKRQMFLVIPFTNEQLRKELLSLIAERRKELEKVINKKNFD